MFASKLHRSWVPRQRIALALTLLGAGIAALIPAQAEAAGTSSDYIVLYESGAGLSQKVASEEARGNDVQDVFRSAVKGYVASLDSADVSRLRAQDGVLLVEKDKPVEALGAGPRSGLASSWGLDRIDQRTLPLNSQISTSQNGFGVTAYIIDTGIRADHAQFGDRVTAGFDAFTDGQNSNDCNGHGTHVAGTVGGSTYGVAPEVSLVAIRVLNCSGSGSTSGVIAGINWATANHAAGVPAVANMSLGGGYSPALNTATQNAISDGISFAVAAGNENADACNVSPASAPNALTVGSTTSSDSRSSFSNWGTCVDIFAPGSAITSAWHSSSSATNTISGTSMASPHVAGAAALLLSASPSSTPAEVATAMGAASTTGAVGTPGVGSVNRLLYTGDAATPNPTPEPPPTPAPTAPANDDFANAVTLSSLAATTGTTVSATRETGEPTHVNSGYGSAKSVWYNWTAPADGDLDVKTEGSSFDTLLAAYTGSSLSALTVKYASDDVIGGNWSRLTFAVTAGTTYRIVIDGYGGSSGSTRLSGTFTAAATPPPTGAPAAPAELVGTAGNSSASVAFSAGSDGGSAITNYEYSTDNGLTWTARSPAATSSPLVISGLTNGTAYSIKLRAVNSVDSGAASSTVSVTPAAPPTPAPANDNFADAVTLSSLAATVGTTVAATHEAAEPSHVNSTLGSTASIWYQWTATEDGSLDLQTQGSSYDTLLAVYSGSSISGLTAVGANDDAPGGLWSRLSLDVTAGTTYKIAVDGYGGRSGSTLISGAFTAKRPAPTPTPTPTPIPEPVAPDTTITESPGTSTTNTRPTFSFISTAEGSDFECQMEGRTWVECTSPFQPEAALSSGFHSFAVRATSPDGLTDETPASVAFTVQTPASDPTTPPALSPGILTPTSTTLSVLGRTATLSITCVPASASASTSARVRVAATDGPCSGRLRLATSRSNSQRTINLGADATSNVAFPIDARTARTVGAGTAVRATLRVTQGATTRSVTVTLRKLSASARSRLLGKARN